MSSAKLILTAKTKLPGGRVARAGEQIAVDERRAKRMVACGLAKFADGRAAAPPPAGPVTRAFSGPGRTRLIGFKSTEQD